MSVIKLFCMSIMTLCLLASCGGGAQPDPAEDITMQEPDFQLYHDQISAIIPLEQAEEKAPSTTWQRFYDLFTPETQPMVRVVFSEWLGVGLTDLDLSPDGKGMEKAFKGSPYEKYMEAVIKFAPTPSARLQYLLTAMDFTANGWIQDGMLEPWRKPGAPNRAEFLGQYIADLLEQAGPGVTSQPEERREGALPSAEEAAKLQGDNIYESSVFSSSGVSDGPSIFFREEFHSISGVKWLNYSTVRETTHLMKQSPGNAWWGHSILHLNNTNEGINYRTVYCITLVENGKIAILTPEPPEKRDFFTNPQTGWGNMVESSQEPMCSNSQVFTFNDDTLALTAKYPTYQTPRDGKSRLGVCVPECEISYVWDGQTFQLHDKSCKPVGEWGYWGYKAP